MRRSSASLEVIIYSRDFILFKSLNFSASRVSIMEYCRLEVVLATDRRPYELLRFIFSQVFEFLIVGVGKV